MSPGTRKFAAAVQLRRSTECQGKRDAAPFARLDLGKSLAVGRR
jgi:hypothetical protein